MKSLLRGTRYRDQLDWTCTSISSGDCISSSLKRAISSILSARIQSAIRCPTSSSSSCHLHNVLMRIRRENEDVAFTEVKVGRRSSVTGALHLICVRVGCEQDRTVAFN